MTRSIVGLLIAYVAFANAMTRADNTAPPEPDGYRLEHYRSPTPKTLQGARVIITAEAEALWKARTAVFVDVMPHAPRPTNLPAGTVWRDKPRLNIPGSIWLPDTGYGALSASTENYLRTAVARATNGDRMKPIVIYCMADCWMSWNAAKRALSLGYSSVAWYPDGTDGWSFANLPLEAAKPAPE
jgi:PQQ-dependent catabolism-associated CXXCW motif protein